MSKYENKPIGVCDLCGTRLAEMYHHKFSQTIINRKHYGKLIDSPFNLCKSCGECNVSHAHIPKWARWDENDFRMAADMEGFQLPERLRSCKVKLG